MVIDPDKIKNIIVIRPDAIGDVVLTLPTIHALRQHFPKAKITVLAREYTAPLLLNHPDIDQVIFDYDLKKFKFDLSVNYYNQFKDTYAVFRAGIPYRLGDSSRILTGWMNNLRVFRKWNDKTRHEVDLNFDLLAPLGINDRSSKAIIPINRSDMGNIDNILIRKAVLPEDFIAVVHIGGSKSHNKSWNAPGYSQLINFLLDKKGAKVIMTGGQDAKEKADKILPLCQYRPISLVDKLSLSELIALLSKANFYFGNDTGPTHIAAALNIPLVVLFTSRWTTPLRWGPWKTRHLVVKNISQCIDRCYPPNCDSNFCEDEVDPKKVISACETVIDGGGVKEPEETFRHWYEVSFAKA